MPRPCSVCAHLQRAEIDRRLSFQVVNLAQLAREYGVGRDAVRAHRAAHLPAFLPAFQASAEALTLGTLAAEAQRLYSVTLDALALAEAGVLSHVGDDGTEHRLVSSTAVARMIKEARQGLGLLVKLSADAGSTDSRPAGVSNGELDARIGQALEGVMARALNAKSSDDVDVTIDGEAHVSTAELVEGEAATLAPIDQPHTDQMGREAGSHLGQAPTTRPPYTLPSRSDTPLETRLDLAPGAYTHLETNPNVSLESLESLEPLNLNELVSHPEWHGSPAATAEERKAAGFADISRELHDPEHDVVARELAAYRERQANATNTTPS